jgi:tetratricopeptide (TPR) repeat protein
VSIVDLAEQIKEKGQRSVAELPGLLQEAERLANDGTQDVLTRGLAHRAAGNAHQLLNRFLPALDSYNASAALLETLDEPVELGRTLHAKVGMLFSLSRFDELFECSARARKLFEQCSDRKRLARLDVNLAHANHRLGRHREALECSERALQVLEELDDREGIVAASINSAVTLTAMHEFERAGERYRTALRLASELNLSSWILLSRYNLAYLRYLGGDAATALEELQFLRAEYAQADDNWMICQCWLDESEILLEIGDLDESIAAARRARSLGQKLGLNAEVAKSFLHEAAATIRLGLNDEAATLLQEATGRFAAEGDKVSTAVSILQSALFRGESGDVSALDDARAARSQLIDSGLPHRLALANIVIGRIQRRSENPDAAIDSFESALSLASGSRSEWMQFHASYELGVSLDQKKDPNSYRFFRQADRLLDGLWDRIGSDELKMSFLADRENVYTHLIRCSVSASPHSAFNYAEKARSRILRERLLGGESFPAIDVLQARLGSDEAVVEYFVSGDDVYTFVLRQDALVLIKSRGVVARIAAEWEVCERHLASCSVKWERMSSVQHHLERTAKLHLQNLYKDLIAPISHELRPKVVIAPHGFLHAIPFHALHDGTRHLAEKHQFAYTPGAALYCLPSRVENFERPLFVAFSNRFSSHCVEEVCDAAAHFADATLLIDPDVQDLREAFRVPRSLVHIAGHAGIDPVGGKLSWIQTNNGVITSRDLTNMKVRAKTILITGCQTARRIIQSGDEWLGLMRSFYLSGASTIVSALWDIRAESAQRFAHEFYKVFDGANAPAAVQQAASSVKEARDHPYFWAGFTTFVRKSV